MKALAAVLLLAAAPAVAQGLPVFNEALGYDVRGTVDDGLIVANGGHVFYCEVDDGPDDRFFVLSKCAPIVGPGAAAQASRATLSKARGEQAFIQALEQMPPSAFIPAVTQSLKEFGCVLDLRTGEDAFIAVLSRNVAKEAVYDGAMTEDLMDAIGELTEDTAELMLDTGLIVLDRDTRKAQLVNCP